MRITVPVVLVGVLLSASHLVVTGQPKYGVTVTTVERAALAKARTYEWRVSQPSYLKEVDKLIIDAVDRELGLRGFTKVPSERTDVTVTYASVARTDVDLNARPGGGSLPPESRVGTLVVELSDATTRQVLFRVRMDTPMEATPETYEATINEAVAAMFAEYPTPPR